MRRILVGVKRVVDANVRVGVRPDGTGVAVDGVKMGINPFDEIALEAALRMREAGEADEVLVASIGPDEAQQPLRTALAMGADRATLVRTASPVEPLAVARILLELVRRESPRIVLLGKQGIDDDNGQVGQMLAALWDRPQATFASAIVLAGDTARVVREVDAGLETLDIDLPAVITADLRLNEPRFVKLPDIMKARKKPLDVLEPADLGVDTAPGFTATGYAAPAPRAKGRQVGDVRELVGALRERGLW